MAIQYVDSVADAAGTVPGTYNISASNDQLSVNLDGSGDQVFTLSHGSAQTAANVVADLAGLTGGVASTASIGGGGIVVRIRTTSASGNSSTILVNAPANNANALLGFIATTYKGGAPTWSYFDGETKQRIINGVESALLVAGWITISGSGTTNLLMQSALSSDTQNLRMRIRVKDLGNTSTSFHLENVSGTKTSTANGGAWLFPQTAKGFKIISNKYQTFIFVEGTGHTAQTTGAREFCAFGVPYLPPNIRGYNYECAWLMTNAQNEGDTACRSSFRSSCYGNVLGAPGIGGPWRTGLCNGNIWEDNNNTLSLGGNGLWSPSPSNGVSTRWHDGTELITDPIIHWARTNDGLEPLAMGQLWEAYVAYDFYWNDTRVTLDSHTWQCITTNNRPSLFLRVS